MGSQKGSGLLRPFLALVLLLGWLGVLSTGPEAVRPAQRASAAIWIPAWQEEAPIPEVALESPPEAPEEVTPEAVPEPVVQAPAPQPATPPPAPAFQVSSQDVNIALGQSMAAANGWTGQQWDCLYNLWAAESGWRTEAHNPSGAHGIPQALPGSKMGPGWESDPVVQITWGIGYIEGRYGTPCGAWGHFQAFRWY